MGRTVVMWAVAQHVDPGVVQMPHGDAREENDREHTPGAYDIGAHAVRGGIWNAGACVYEGCTSVVGAGRLENSPYSFQTHDRSERRPQFGLRMPRQTGTTVLHV